MTPGSEYLKILENKFAFNPEAKGFVGFREPITSNKDLLMFFTFVLAINMLMLSGVKAEEAFMKVKNCWLSGKVLEKFIKICELQGGDYNAFVKRG